MIMLFLISWILLKVNLQERLANVVIVSSLGIFDLRNMPLNATKYGQEEIALLYENFQLNVDDTLLEWAQLQERFKQDKETCSFQHLFFKLCSWKPNLGNIYPNLKKLIATACTLNISSAEWERVFSRVKTTISIQRNRKTVRNLNRVLHIVMNGNERDNFSFCEVAKEMVSSEIKKAY